MSLVSYQTALLRSVGPKTGGRKKKVEYKSLPCLDKQIVFLYRMERVAGIEMERVAGIEPASLAWKARGYSRRWLIIFDVSNSKPNMKF